jgi:hypothetical protein
MTPVHASRTGEAGLPNKPDSTAPTRSIGVEDLGQGAWFNELASVFDHPTTTSHQNRDMARPTENGNEGSIPRAIENRLVIGLDYGTTFTG